MYIFRYMHPYLHMLVCTSQVSRKPASLARLTAHTVTAAVSGTQSRSHMRVLIMSTRTSHSASYVQVDASQLAGLSISALSKTARECGVILTSAMTAKPSIKDKIEKLREMAKSVKAAIGNDVGDKKSYVRAIEEKQVLYSGLLGSSCACIF
jgi:hypothetical protein